MNRKVSQDKCIEAFYSNVRPFAGPSRDDQQSDSDVIQKQQNVSPIPEYEQKNSITAEQYLAGSA